MMYSFKFCGEGDNKSIFLKNLMLDTLSWRFILPVLSCSAWGEQSTADHRSIKYTNYDPSFWNILQVRPVPDSMEESCHTLAPSVPTTSRENISFSPLQVWNDLPQVQMADQGQGHHQTWGLGVCH